MQDSDQQRNGAVLASPVKDRRLRLLTGQITGIVYRGKGEDKEPACFGGKIATFI